MNCFKTAPDFIKEDNRRFRPRNPITQEQMYNKHVALLPEAIIRGKSVLDLGCCIGATGHWCLSNGASHYTGIELQPEYVQIAEKLLNKYHPGKFNIQQMAIEEWLNQPDKPSFDVVCLLGVIYIFVDYFSVLKLATDITRSTLVIENCYARILKKNPNYCGVEFMNDQTINLSTETSSLIGRGTRITPNGLQWLMKSFSFTSNEGIIRPEPITGSPDVYNRPIDEMTEIYSARFLMRFVRTEVLVNSLSENLKHRKGEKDPWIK